MTYSHINYEEDPSVEPSSQWTVGELKKYWNKLYLKYHRGGGHLWNIKEITLLSRIVKEYTAEITAKMMEWWMTNCTWQQAGNFIIFYNRREEINQKLQGYRWE